MRRFCMATITASLVGLPYKLGTMDCFMLILRYLDIREIEYPSEFQGWNRKTYTKLYKDDSEQAKSVMVDFVDSFLDAIPAHTAKTGDLYLLKLEGKDVPPALAINGGNGNVVCVTEKQGVTVAPLREYKIERTWKCHK